MVVEVAIGAGNIAAGCCTSSSEVDSSTTTVVCKPPPPPAASIPVSSVCSFAPNISLVKVAYMFKYCTFDLKSTTYILHNNNTSSPTITAMCDAFALLLED